MCEFSLSLTQNDHFINDNFHFHHLPYNNHSELELVNNHLGELGGRSTCNRALKPFQSWPLPRLYHVRNRKRIQVNHIQIVNPQKL